MNRVVFILCCFFLLLGCEKNNPNDRDFSYLEYQLSSDQYAVIVLPKDSASDAQSKKAALQHAAKMTLQRGFRYFIVQSEGTVFVASSQSEEGALMPRDMYYDIIQRQGDKTFHEQYSKQTGQIRPGYRLAFTCSKTKESLQAVDACSLTPCP